MSLKIWEINNLKLELDMEDADVQERYENALKLFDDERKQILKEREQNPENAKLSKFTRSVCALFKRFFDRVFGEGNSEKIFEGITVSLSKYFEIYDSFHEFIKQQMDDVNDNIMEKFAKYRPNRQQRRNKKK